MLVKAIRTESVEALGHWFGVTAGVVWKWRKAPPTTNNISRNDSSSVSC
jgi:hypothetical protein